QQHPKALSDDGHCKERELTYIKTGFPMIMLLSDSEKQVSHRKLTSSPFDNAFPFQNPIIKHPCDELCRMQTKK
ncbi:hypothetical protein, partial [Endozoicomonas sp. ONNA2]|uniref:hypothetical protein n=1 Tax=Endozoicomonas sp. ONNA2 TaxID=2828741 RepID=UPI0021489685